MADFHSTCFIPAFLQPWLDRFYTPTEIRLLQILAKQKLSESQVRRQLGPEQPDDFLERAWKRGVVNRSDGGGFEPADFHDRFEKWALFEGWQDLPEAIKTQLNKWELDDYVERHRHRVEQLKAGQPRPTDAVCPEYLVLDEVTRLFERIPRFYLWPCNCRAMMEGCNHSRLTCIRFSNDRGIGWEISRERALSIVGEANRQGLMQSAELAVDDQGHLDGALCNCCSDCCFPNQLAARLQAEKTWPLRRHMALPPSEACNGCGRCIRRCPFDAISQEKRVKGQPAQTPVIDSGACRGCGVCATGCPQGAIQMQKIKASAMEDYYA